jgi:LEA14-like dessication related protein
MNLKLVAIIVVVVVVIGAGVTIYSQPGPPPAGLKISLDSARVLSASNTHIALLVQLRLDNTGSQDVTLYGTTYSLSANGINLASGYMSQKTLIKSGATSHINSTVNIDLSDNPAFSNTASGLLWRMKGTADLGTPNGNLTSPIDFNFQG